MNQEVKELRKQVVENGKKLEEHLQMIQKNSYALDILKDYKKGYQSAYILVLVFVFLWVITNAILLYVILNK